MLRFLLFFLLVAHAVSAKKLVIDTIDPESGKVVKETEWIKLRTEDRSVMDIKIKRIGNKVCFYYTASCKNGKKCSDSYYTFTVTFSNDDKIMLEQRITLSQSGTSKAAEKYVPKPTDQPEGIGTPLLCDADLDKLKSNDIVSIEYCLLGHNHTMVLKEKYRDALKEYAALVD